VTLYDFGQSDSGELYIAMELMTGVTLAYLIEQKNLKLADILEIMDQVCQSVRKPTTRESIHRDLKPDNVFIDRVGNRNIVKVLDFASPRCPIPTSTSRGQGWSSHTCLHEPGASPGPRPRSS